MKLYIILLIILLLITTVFLFYKPKKNNKDYFQPNFKYSFVDQDTAYPKNINDLKNALQNKIPYIYLDGLYLLDIYPSGMPASQLPPLQHLIIPKECHIKSIYPNNPAIIRLNDWYPYLMHINGGTIENIILDGNNKLIHTQNNAGLLFVQNDSQIIGCTLTNNMAKPVHFIFPISDGTWLKNISQQYPDLLDKMFENVPVFLDADAKQIIFDTDKPPGSPGWYASADPAIRTSKDEFDGWELINYVPFFINYYTKYAQILPPNQLYLPYESPDYAFGTACGEFIVTLAGNNILLQDCIIWNGRYGIYIGAPEGTTYVSDIIIQNNHIYNIQCDAITTNSGYLYNNLEIKKNRFSRIRYLCYNNPSIMSLAKDDLSYIYEYDKAGDIPAAAFYSTDSIFKNSIISDNIIIGENNRFGLVNSQGVAYSVCGNAIDLNNVNLMSPEDCSLEIMNNKIYKSKQFINNLRYENDPLHEKSKCIGGNAIAINVDKTLSSNSLHIVNNVISWHDDFAINVKQDFPTQNNTIYGNYISGGLSSLPNYDIQYNILTT